MEAVKEGSHYTVAASGSRAGAAADAGREEELVVPGSDYGNICKGLEYRLFMYRYVRLYALFSPLF